MKGRNGKLVAQGGGWGRGMGKGSCPRCVKISLCLVWPTKCLNRYEHLNINRHPSKARFPGSFERGEGLGLAFPQSISRLAWNAACPLRILPSPGPKSSATAPAWYLGIYYGILCLIEGVRKGIWHTGSSWEQGDLSLLMLQKATG